MLRHHGYSIYFFLIITLLPLLLFQRGYIVFRVRKTVDTNILERCKRAMGGWDRAVVLSGGSTLTDDWAGVHLAECRSDWYSWIVPGWRTAIFWPESPGNCVSYTRYSILSGQYICIMVTSSPHRNSRLLRGGLLPAQNSFWNFFSELLGRCLLV